MPKRLSQQAGVIVVGKEPPCAIDGTLIIRRWPTPVVLRRLAGLLEVTRTPVLLCTAAPSEDCARALSLGIADILRDDMHHAEVMARLALRCGRDHGAHMAYGPLLLDRMQRMVWLNGRMLRLTALQFDLLAALMQGGGAVVSADMLRQAVWHSAHDPGTNRIAVHIHHIRRALEDAGGPESGGGAVRAEVRAEGGGYRLIL